ncbi:MAG: hypothetical protein KKB20_25015, partial [Proteobacteria bacterium]|nr:hypothetical protein [Pseudomonadota bacterium]
YFTCNPCSPALLARAANRLVAGGAKKPTTSDKDIVCLRWLLIDLDPRRPSGISSTADELAAAQELGGRIAAWLEVEMGFPKGVRAWSGNGIHINYRLPDLPNTDENKALLKRCLQAVAARFQDDLVEVDTTVHNPARIWKVYGTTARKGDNLPERPHRRGSLFPESPARLEDVPVATVDLVEKLAGLAPQDASPAAPPAPVTPQKTGKTRAMGSNDLGTLDMEAYLSRYGIEYKVKPDGGVTRYILRQCVFDPSHQPNEASICQSPSPPFLTYQCFHNSCQDKTWKMARREISGEDSLAPFCSNYDPNWQPPAKSKRPAAPAKPEAPAAGDGAAWLDQYVDMPDRFMMPEGAVDHPEDTDPLQYFEVTARGRATFSPSLMANYLVRYLRYIVYTEGEFWFYDSGVWRPFNKQTLANLIDRALRHSSKPRYVDETIKTLAARVSREEEAWPAQGRFINCLDGMVDVNTEDMRLLPHEPAYGSRTQVPCHYRPELLVKEEPGVDYLSRWDEFLDEIFPNEPAKLEVLQQFFGYCLMMDCRYEKALFLYGTGSNGKGTVVDVLRAMVGDQNAASLSMEDLGDPKFSLYFLQNKLVNIATETPTRNVLATEVYKKVVSGEPVTTERKYGSKYEFRPYAKFVVSMNDLPVIPDRSYGFERRAILLQFNRRFVAGQGLDPDLKRTLVQETDYVFMWSLEGLKKLLASNGFLVGEKVTEDTGRFIQALNPVLTFLEECCITDNPEVKVKVSELWESYKDWCKDSGQRALAKNRFMDQIAMHVPQAEKRVFGKTRLVHMIGLGLVSKIEYV